jgi:hypothetical protein
MAGHWSGQAAAGSVGRQVTEPGSNTLPVQYPRVCCVCGERILVSKEGFWAHVEGATLEHMTWHLRCAPPWSIPAAPGGVGSTRKESDPETCVH